jgi:hypothetical protein
MNRAHQEKLDQVSNWIGPTPKLHIYLVLVSGFSVFLSLELLLLLLSRQQGLDVVELVLVMQ